MTDNPYAGYGVVVTGPRLVGRGEEIARVASDLRAGGGSAALVGEPRVGKSSMANAVIQRIADSSPGLRTLWVDLGSAEPTRGLIALLHQVVTDQDNSPEDPDSLYAGLKRFLSESTQQGRGHVVVIDEFDAIRGLGTPDLDSRRLRELVSRPDLYGLSTLLVARRRIGRIEEAIPNLSTLDGVCRTYFVRPLDRLGIESMFRRGFPEGPMTDQIDRVWELFGGQPFLSEALLWALWDSGDMDTAQVSTSDTARRYFGSLIRAMGEEGHVGVAREIAAGTSVSACESLETLIQYGVVVGDGRGAQVIFCAALRERLLVLPDASPPIWATDP